MSHQEQLPCLYIVADPGSHAAELAVLEALARADGWRVERTAVVPELDETVALAVLAVAQPRPVRQCFPHALLVGATDTGPAAGEIDLPLVRGLTESALGALLQHGRSNWRRNLKLLEAHREVDARRRRTRQLADIALAVSMRMEFGELLETILREARRLAGCEAGSLYLIDDEGDEPALVFKLAQNDVVELELHESRLPLTPTSIAGYVAISGETLDIPDVYDLPPGLPFSFNRSFDEEMGYRTRSMLVLPMRDHRDRIVGVLQFINRVDPTADLPVAFGEEIGELLRAVASQAAVSIQKNLLISDINRLFESFVQASVKTIERRDPSTSGHSFRVAESTVALLQALPASNLARFRRLELPEEHIREVRYAALLHDFGKVGVPERVLLKANKLTDERLQTLQYRFELHKERLRRRAVEREIELLHHGSQDFEVARRRLHRQLEAELSLVDDYFECVRRANRPSVLQQGDFQHLQEIRDYRFLDVDGTHTGLIDHPDLLALSVPKGSLTPDERRVIEAHVQHTREFLAVLPWPPELARVPEIAGAHHEKLDGSGYPLGLAGDQIPLAARVMTVCDIYDALTAMDRPYKSALPAEAALNVLHDEVSRGLLDADLVAVFVDSGLYKAAGGALRSSTARAV
ncbi:MAG: HD domain-containing phosphohydrolase [Pseudomonadales bacterium]